MLILLLLIISAILIFVYVEDFLGKYKWLAYTLIGICLIMYAGFRPIGFDRDSSNYEALFMHPDDRVSAISVEPFFLIICKILYFVSPDAQILLLFFAILGITMKFFAIKRLTPLFFLPLIIYVGNFYILHDLTQIRAGIASGCFLLSIKPLSEDKKLKAFIYILSGALFHYSAFALLPLLLLNNKLISRHMKFVLACIVPICFALYILDLDLLTTIPIPYITSKVETYKALSEYSLDKESILNPFPLIKMAVFLYLLYFSETVKLYIPSIYIIIKILGCSLVAYFVFSSVKIVSMRISELYGVVELIAYSSIVYTIKPLCVARFVVCIIAFIEIYFNLVQWKILDFTV